MPEFTEGDVRSLAAKLDQLDLTDGEKAALVALADEGRDGRVADELKRRGIL